MHWQWLGKQQQIKCMVLFSGSLPLFRAVGALKPCVLFKIWQYLTSSFLGTYFLAVTAIQVSKESALGNKDGVQDSICLAIVVGTIFATVGSGFLVGYTDRALSSVLKGRQPDCFVVPV